MAKTKSRYLIYTKGGNEVVFTAFGLKYAKHTKFDWVLKIPQDRVESLKNVRGIALHLKEGELIIPQSAIDLIHKVDLS